MKNTVKRASLVVTVVMAAVAGPMAWTSTSQGSEFASGFCTVIRACFNPSQE